MSLKLNKYVPPDHCEGSFDFERGTPVRVVTRGKGVFEGEVTYTPRKHGKPQCLELINVTKIAPKQEPAKTLHFMRFEHRQLQSVVAIGPPNIINLQKKTEYLHLMFMVDDAESFGRLEKFILTMKPKEVGLYFCGLNVGRGGDLYYIAMLIMDTIVIIDCENTLSDYEGYMMRLDTLLFSNEGIVKVAYNSRHIADWLYHHESIYLKNIFDIQVAEFFLWGRYQPVNQLMQNSKNLKYKRLSECFEEFLDPSYLLEDELAVLKEYEVKEFTEFDHPMGDSPFVDMNARKWVAIEVKHLLRLRDVIMERMFKLFNDSMTINVSDHVACRAFHPQYDITDVLAIPPSIIQKFIPTLGLGGDIDSFPTGDQTTVNNQTTAETATGIQTPVDDGSTTDEYVTASSGTD